MWAKVLGGVSGPRGGVGTHGVVGLADIIGVLVECGAGIGLISLFKLDLEIFVKVLIPEDDVIGLLVLVHGEALHIGIDFLGLPVVREDGLGRAQLVLIVEVEVCVEILVVQGLPAQVAGPIVVKLLLVGRAPEDCAAETILLTFLRRFHLGIGGSESSESLIGLLLRGVLDSHAGTPHVLVEEIGSCTGRVERILLLLVKSALTCHQGCLGAEANHGRGPEGVS